MHAELRSLDSPDLAPESLDSYRPPASDHFGILLLALVGPADGPGEEAFYVTVCSPSWLAEAAMRDDETDGYEFIQHRLVVQSWDTDLIRRALADLCHHTTGKDWSEVATKLSRYLAWELAE